MCVWRNDKETDLEIVVDGVADEYAVLDEVCDSFLDVVKGECWAVVVSNRLWAQSTDGPLSMCSFLIPLYLVR